MSATALELYGTKSCPYTAELREELEWQGDVERDLDAMRRMTSLREGAAAVPVLVEDGRVVQVGFKGRSCYVASVAPKDDRGG